jgi:hypothetical protein
MRQKLVGEVNHMCFKKFVDRDVVGRKKFGAWNQLLLRSFGPIKNLVVFVQ